MYQKWNIDKSYQSNSLDFVAKKEVVHEQTPYYLWKQDLDHPLTFVTVALDAKISCLMNKVIRE